MNIKRILAIASSLAIFSVVIFYLLLTYTKEGLELRMKAKQYVDMNVNQNWGIRKNILISIDFLLTLFPEQVETIEIDKNSALQGAKLKNSDLSGDILRSKKLKTVENAQQLQLAIRNAVAGELILIEPGTYEISRRKITLKHSGTAENPIILAARNLGEVKLKLRSLEGLFIDQAHWQVKNLSFEGICERDGRCEHAIHLYGDADHILIHNNIFKNFNSPIKANGDYSDAGEPAAFADNVTVSSNDFYNDRPRVTGLPTTAIDVVGGNDWLIENNFIADFVRKFRGKNVVVYMAFLKGAGKNSVIQDNIVMCSWKIPYQSSRDIRVGLSLGNGGTQAQFCQDGKCVSEHSGGLIQRNLIVNCEHDVGIYLNKASNTRIQDNVILNSLGIDVRFPTTSATVTNNILHGRVKARDGASLTSEGNRIVPYGQLPQHGITVTAQP